MNQILIGIFRQFKLFLNYLKCSKFFIIIFWSNSVKKLYKIKESSDGIKTQNSRNLVCLLRTPSAPLFP